MNDQNYVSIAGTENGELWLVDYRNPPGLTNVLLRAAGDNSIVRVELGIIECPPGYADALKFSGATGVVAHADRITGGYEDVVDINHSSDINLTIDSCEIKGKHLATGKGGSADISICALNIEGRGTDYDFDLGNWSDQSQVETKRVRLFAQRVDGQASTVRSICAERPWMDTSCKWKYNGWLRGWFPVVQKFLKNLGIG